MEALVNSFLNEARINCDQSGNEMKRKEIVKVTEAFKVASAVTIIASAILFAAFASLGTFCLLLPVAYVAYEIGTLANNYQKTCEDWKSAVKVNLSNRQFLLHMTERAPVSRSIVKLTGLV